MTDFGYLIQNFLLNNLYLQIAFTADINHTLQVLINWLKAISCQEQTYVAGCNTSQKQKGISIFKLPRAKSGTPEHTMETCEHVNFFLS